MMRSFMVRTKDTKEVVGLYIAADAAEVRHMVSDGDTFDPEACEVADICETGDDGSWDRAALEALLKGIKSPGDQTWKPL